MGPCGRTTRGTLPGRHGPVQPDDARPCRRRAPHSQAAMRPCGRTTRGTLPGRHGPVQRTARGPCSAPPVQSGDVRRTPAAAMGPCGPCSARPVQPDDVRPLRRAARAAHPWAAMGPCIRTTRGALPGRHGPVRPAGVRPLRRAARAVHSWAAMGPCGRTTRGSLLRPPRTLAAGRRGAVLRSGAAPLPSGRRACPRIGGPGRTPGAPRARAGVSVRAGTGSRGGRASWGGPCPGRGCRRPRPPPGSAAAGSCRSGTRRRRAHPPAWTRAA